MQQLNVHCFGGPPRAVGQLGVLNTGWEIPLLQLCPAHVYPTSLNLVVTSSNPPDDHESMVLMMQTKAGVDIAWSIGWHWYP